MSHDTANTALSKIQHDIHAERVEPECLCDYCGIRVDITSPVLYDVIRISDASPLGQALDFPDFWLPDAVRCHGCAIETITPATNSYDEALVRVGLIRVNDTISIDTTSIELVDYSPPHDGYGPPTVSLSKIIQDCDLGLGRWIRIAAFLDAAPPNHKMAEYFTTVCETSPDAPPGLR